MENVILRATGAIILGLIIGYYTDSSITGAFSSAGIYWVTLS